MAKNNSPLKENNQGLFMKLCQNLLQTLEKVEETVRKGVFFHNFLQL